MLGTDKRLNEVSWPGYFPVLTAGLQPGDVLGMFDGREGEDQGVVANLAASDAALFQNKGSGGRRDVGRRYRRVLDSPTPRVGRDFSLQPVRVSLPVVVHKVLEFEMRGAQPPGLLELEMKMTTRS